MQREQEQKIDPAWESGPQLLRLRANHQRETSEITQVLSPDAGSRTIALKTRSKDCAQSCAKDRRVHATVARNISSTTTTLADS